MAEDASPGVAPLTQGCMECKAQRLYTVGHFANGNTGWRCVVCGRISRLIPGTYTSPSEEK
jgi:hypothetical protein